LAQIEQNFHVRFRSTLAPIKEWAAENGLHCKVREKHVVVDNKSFHYEMVLTCFERHPNGEKLLDALTSAKGFRWLSHDDAFAQEEKNATERGQRRKVA